MARNTERTELSLGNRIYLYRLLRDRVGCGKQTFLPAVEDALAAEGWTAPEIGFATTRELLEALDDFISLTVFKGGRVYATIVAQPSWDEALAAPAETKKASGGKSWKRKRGDKALKPIAPRRQRREPERETQPKAEQKRAHEPEPEPAPELQSEPAPESPSAPVPQAAPEADSAAEPQAAPGSEPASNLEPAPASAPEPGPEQPQKPETEPAYAPAPQPSPEAEQAAAPEPAISLTIVYEPEEADANVPADAEAPVATGAQPSAAAAEPARPAPAVDLSGYPVDFTTEVYCPAAHLSTLAALLPLGADVLGIAGAYFDIACQNGTAKLGRARAVFPLRYLRDGKRVCATVRIKKRPGATGAPWMIDAVDVACDQTEGEQREGNRG